MTRILIIAAAVLTFFCIGAQNDPTATHYSVDDCLGSAKPYAAPETRAELPDSLTPVFINHIGRHGARYLSSPNGPVKLARQLAAADSAGVLSPLGKEMLAVVTDVIEASHNRWGALDSLGMAEQRGIASRMFRAFPTLFNSSTVHAISSYSPRCVMSMYEFTHQLDRLNNSIEITTSSGRSNSLLLRPFDVVESYMEWASQKPWEAPYEMFFETTAPASPAQRLVTDANRMSNKEATALSWNAYSVLRGLPAMGRAIDMTRYFTTTELNSLWACENLRHYLRRTATTLSLEPAESAADLLLNIINTTDAAAEGKNTANVELRFCHAETLMPLFALMRLPGCYYLTNYFDTVALHWKDFYVVPMASNLQIVLLRSKRGELYVRFDLNEIPIAINPNSPHTTIIPWSDARAYLMRCLPFHMQI